ncbi:MAG: hypothetical protein ACP5HQ_07830 [Thermoprotei archaeon]
MKYYEDEEEEDYETKEILLFDVALDVISGLLKGTDLTPFDAIDVYYSEIEVEGTKEERQAIVLDFIPISGKKDKVYLVYLKDYDERMWESLRKKVEELLKELKGFNVCDEDKEFLSLCRVYEG